MAISKDEVKRLAQLARLRFTDEELDRLASELGKILGYIRKLDELDTTSVEPLYYVNEYDSVTRPDVVSGQIGREHALSSAPKADDRFFHVPKVIE